MYSDDLVPHQLQDSIHHGLKTLQNLLIRERHITLLNSRLRELSFNAHIHSPLLPVIPKVGLDTVLKVHDALGVHLARRARPVRQLHLADLGAQDVGEVAVERCGAAGVTAAGCAFGDGEGLFVFDFVGDEIDGAATAIDDEDGVAMLEVEEAGFRAEHGCCFGLRDQR